MSSINDVGVWCNQCGERLMPHVCGDPKPQRTVKAWLTRGSKSDFHVLRFVPSESKEWWFEKGYVTWERSKCGIEWLLDDDMVTMWFGPKYIMPGGPDSIKKVEITVPLEVK